MNFITGNKFKDISDYISIKGYDQTKQLTKNLNDYLL
jgi:hypothetical protein